MDIMHFVSHLDTQLLLLINGMHNHYFDGFMYAISAVKIWIPFYLSVIYIVIAGAKKQSIWIILSLVLCVVIADQVASGIIKEAVQRLRPTHNPAIENIIHLVNGYKGGQYGFVSSHAANSFGFALLSSLFLRNKLYSYMVFFWAVLVSYSRMYLGVHYPLDIVGGAIVGFSAAIVCFIVLKRFFPLAAKSNFSTKLSRIPNYVLLLSYLSIAIYSIAIL